MIVDVSHWKTVTNWSLAKKGCEFLISKATQGTTYIDTYLDTFVENCEAKNIPYWLYTFLNKGNEIEQTKFFVEQVNKRVGKNFVGYILDVESKNTATGVQEALNYLTSLGKKCMIYTGYADISLYKKVVDNLPSNCKWWEARYGKNNGQYNQAYPPHKGCDLHQYTSVGSLPYVTSSCDLNRLTGKTPLSWFISSDHMKQPDSHPVNAYGVAYRAHCQTHGDFDAVRDGMWAGTMNYNKRCENLLMDFRTLNKRLGFELDIDVLAHIQKKGWVRYNHINNNTRIGTANESLRLEDIIVICHNLPDNLELYYQAHVHHYGTLPKVKNGESCASQGMRIGMEAFRMWIEEK